MRISSIALLLGVCSLPALAQQFGPLENLAPDIPTPETIVQKILEAGRVKPGDTVYDIGSGDGRILISAVRDFGAKAVGIEILPDLCEKARKRVKSLGLDDRIRIVQGSALRMDLSPADVVTMCLLTGSNERMRPVLEKYLKPGARVVSSDFPIKGWKPLDSIRIREGRMQHTIYVYAIGKTK